MRADSKGDVVNILGLLVMLLLAASTQAYGEQEIQPIAVKESSGPVLEVYPAHPEMKNPEVIHFRPIGVFRTPYTPDTGAPRQGVLQPETAAVIEIDPVYRKGLADLDNFEYIIVLYYFNLSRTWSPVVKPPMSSRHFGLFATRSPRRPNPIGFSVVKLESVDMEKGILNLRGIDAFDGTPVLDIKPYIPSVDIVRSPKNVEAEKKYGL